MGAGKYRPDASDALDDGGGDLLAVGHDLNDAAICEGVGLQGLRRGFTHY